MQRVLVGKGCQQLDVGGIRYNARDRQGGLFEMSDGHAAMAVKMGGAIAGLGGTSARRSVGWRCPSCGFGSFLKRCGRCGGDCEREA